MNFQSFFGWNQIVKNYSGRDCREFREQVIGRIMNRWRCGISSEAGFGLRKRLLEEETQRFFLSSENSVWNSEQYFFANFDVDLNGGKGELDGGKE